MFSLCWSLLLLSEKKHIQESVQRELDAVIGFPRATHLPLQDFVEKRTSLTYSMATFWEVCQLKCTVLYITKTSISWLLFCSSYRTLQTQVMRFGSTITMTFARRVTKPVVVRGCDVPADSLLSINFWSINRDPSKWDAPEEFKPEHFYAVDEKGVASVKNLDRLVPFSIGASFNWNRVILLHIQIFTCITYLYSTFHVFLSSGFFFRSARVSNARFASSVATYALLRALSPVQRESWGPLALEYGGQHLRRPRTAPLYDTFSSARRQEGCFKQLTREKIIKREKCCELIN